MIIRKIGKFLRGNATAFQIVSATVLGGLLGSLPGFGQGPLLMLCLLFLVMVLNANLFLAGITLLIVKLISLLLLPVYFSIGVTLLEGPLGNLVAGLVNAPVTAWFGLDYYVMIPSLAVGGLLGLLSGILLSRSLNNFRKRMAQLEDGSEKYKTYTSKKWVKVLAWLFVGGLKGKKSWAELSDVKKGLPVRPLGIVFVVSLAVLLVVGLKFLDKTILTSTVRDALEKANGATVDIGGIEIQPGENRVIMTGLAMADPENLQTNRFASREITADISGMNLLAKKIVIDARVVAEPMAGSARKVAGKRTVEVPEPEKVEVQGDEVSLEEYLGQAGVWRERLATAKRVYEKLAPLMEQEEATGEEIKQLSWRERLAQQARELGYARVKSDSLIRESPQLLIRELKADNLEVGGNDDLFAVTGTNLSSQPALLSQRGELVVLRSDGKLEVMLGLPTAASPSSSVLKIRYSQLAVSELEEQVGKDLPMEGGTMDIVGEGSIDNSILDVPLTVTLFKTTLNAFGTTVPLDNFPLQVRLLGPLESPKLDIPQDALEKAAQAAGKGAVENLIKEKTGTDLKKLLPFGG